MGIRESKTATCDRCRARAEWEKQWEMQTDTHARATRGPEDWGWLTLFSEPGEKQWRGLLCPFCVALFKQWLVVVDPHSLKP